MLVDICIRCMQYGGFAIDPILLVKAKSFVSLLADERKPINTKIFYSAGYGKRDCRLSTTLLGALYLLTLAVKKLSTQTDMLDCYLQIRPSALLAGGYVDLRRPLPVVILYGVSCTLDSKCWTHFRRHNEIWVAKEDEDSNKAAH
jgi:hypothetical protein